MLLAAQRQQQRWLRDVVPATTMFHRCCWPAPLDSNNEPALLSRAGYERHQGTLDRLAGKFELGADGHSARPGARPRGVDVMSVLIGCNSRIFDSMQEAGVNARTFRAYRDQYNFVPVGWPEKESVPDARVMLSIRPVPEDLLAGRLDEQLKTLIAMAPAGVRLSAWHEASNLAGYPDYVTSANMSAVHEYMQDLCRGSNVRYGSIICAVPSQTKPWMGRGLDWYGLDVYDFGGGQFRNWWNGGISKTKLFARLDDMLRTCRELSGSDNPEIDICETNSPRPSYRADWFELLAEWMSANGGHSIETFWNPSGPLSGPWLPEDEKTIGALRSIAAT